MGCNKRFGWLFLTEVNPILSTGVKRPLENTDLDYLDADRNVEVLVQEFLRLHANGLSPLKCFYRIFWKYFWIGALSYIFAPACQFLSPWFLGKIVASKLDFVAAEETGETPYMPWIWVLGMFLSQLGVMQFQAISDYFSVRMALQARTLMSTIVYRQSVLAHDGSKVAEGSLNLIAQDAQRLVEFAVMLHRSWTAPLVLAGGIAYIYVLIGPSVFAGLALMFGFLPIAIIFGNMSYKYARVKMKFTDSRISFISETLQGIKVVKSNAWEHPVIDMINARRLVETLCLLKLAFAKAFIVPLSITVPTLASVVTFLVLYSTNDEFNSSKAFQIVSVFTVLRMPFVVFPIGLSLFIQVMVSFKRLDEFLKIQRRNDPVDRPALTREANTHKWPIGPKKDVGSKVPQKKEDGVALSKSQISNGGESTANSKDVVLTDVASIDTEPSLTSPKEKEKDFELILPALDIPKGTFLAVVGRVGAGKTAFLRTILGETTNSFQSHDRIAYCSQDPFIRHATIKENIVNMEKWDEERYRDVIKRCQLQADMKLFPDADATEIGERGINLSGGQKARLGLARAIYSQCDILVFDDILAALDPYVAGKVTTDVLLHEQRSRVVVTQDMDVAKRADFIMYIDNGVATKPCTFTDLLADSSSFVDFVDACAAPEESEGGEDTEEGTDEDEKKENEELSISAGIPEATASRRQTKRQTKTQSSRPSLELAPKEKFDKEEGLVEKEKLQRGYVHYSTYKTYFGAGTRDNIFIFLLFISTFGIAEAAYMSVDTWLGHWSDNMDDPDSSHYVEVYGGLAIGYMLLQLVRSCALAYFGYVASKVLHLKLMRSIFASPLRFFDETPSGRILNRASKDTNDIDMMIPDRYQFMIMCSCRVLSILILICAILPIFAATLIPLFVSLYFVARYYRFSSRELQRLESVTRSPIFSLYTESLQGLSTFRAFKWEKYIAEEYERLLDSNVRAFYSMRIAELWLQSRMMTMGSFMVGFASIAVVLSYAGYIPTDLSQGMAGLVLAQALGLIANLMMAIRNFAQVEASMNSVERIVEYVNLPPEEAALVSVTSKAKPEKEEEFQLHSGGIVFENVTAVYREGLDPTLNGVSLQIKAGALVGICGRTGAGKSTLFLALLRLIPTQGKVLLDGRDIAYIPLNQLRKSISSVPQDPVLFSGSLRHNLDMFDEFTDEELWGALEKASFKKTIESTEQGLDIEVSNGGKNWSAGERQMICFARALLRKNKILLLDEATSSMDGATDRTIQKVLREELRNTTRLVIAHRLQTIDDADQILLIDSGKIMKNGGPEIVKQLMNEEQIRNRLGES